MNRGTISVPVRMSAMWQESIGSNGKQVRFLRYAVAVTVEYTLIATDRDIGKAEYCDDAGARIPAGIKNFCCGSRYRGCQRFIRV